MTYLDDNKDSGEDNQFHFRRYYIGRKGTITTLESINMKKYYYKDNHALITYKDIKPGDIQYKLRAFAISPPDMMRGGIVIYSFLRENSNVEIETSWVYSPDMRRTTRRLSPNRNDTISSSQITWDDWNWREPWEENHKILGEDTINGLECFVVESIHHDPNYYLSKRITWIEKHNFIDLHEEQFNKDGTRDKIIDREWKQIEPGNYWAKVKQDYYNADTQGRTIEEIFNWIFDQHPREDLFEAENMRTEKFWGEIKPIPPPIRRSADLPPKPRARTEFWQKARIKTKTEKRVP